MNKKKEAPAKNMAKVSITVDKRNNEKRKWRYYYTVVVETDECRESESGYASYKWIAVLWAKDDLKKMLRGSRTTVYKKEFNVKVQ